MSALVAEADRAAASGDIARAIELLEQAGEAQAGQAEYWMKMAALRRAAGQPAKALDAIHRVLALSEFDFMALVMRATLIERLEPAKAGEAWARALAQRPAGDLPPQVLGALARGEAARDAWLQAREDLLEEATAKVIAETGSEEADDIRRFRSNTLRKTRTYHSEATHFSYPGLVTREFHRRSDHPWLAELEEQVEAICEELAAVMASERAELVPYIQYQDHEALEQWRPLNQNPDWTAIHLMKSGKMVEANARHCPRTMELLARLPQPDIPGASPNAMFSLLAPRTTIPPHVGYNNARLVCHLPLIVPEGCWFRVGGETRRWVRGEAFVFDDTVEHEAANPSDELRIVFIFDVWHPGLGEAGREAVRRVVSSDGGDAAL